MLDVEELNKQLEDLKTRREEVFKKFQEDKDNPYWYEDWGCIIDDLDERIERTQHKISLISE